MGATAPRARALRRRRARSRQLSTVSPRPEHLAANLAPLCYFRAAAASAGELAAHVGPAYAAGGACGVLRTSARRRARAARRRADAPPRPEPRGLRRVGRGVRRRRGPRAARARGRDAPLAPGVAIRCSGGGRLPRQRASATWAARPAISAVPRRRRRGRRALRPSRADAARAREELALSGQASRAARASVISTSTAPLRS